MFLRQLAHSALATNECTSLVLDLETDQRVALSAAVLPRCATGPHARYRLPGDEPP